MWEFWIDVGGTFTDCVARSPSGDMLTFKTLSSGATPGQVARVAGVRQFVDPLRTPDPDEFWTGSTIRFLDQTAQVIQETTIDHSSPRVGLEVADPLCAQIGPGTSYEVRTGEPAPILAIRHVLGLPSGEPLPPVHIRLGTTRGTNALLERAGARTALVTTRGFADVLLIGNQDRPRLFDLAIQKPEPLFSAVVEVDERVSADGAVLRGVETQTVRRQLQELRDSGAIDSIAICFLHAYRFPDHEQLVAQIAAEVGFRDVSRSSAAAPLIKFVSRGDTTVLDAYLQPVLRDYITGIRASLSRDSRIEAGFDFSPPADPRRSSLKVMTSSGGLVDAARFNGAESILSGPAGGVVGFSRAAEQAGFRKAIGFDMGGTSTDVARYDGRFELQFETQKAGVRIMSPVLAIETVAAGGGSICRFDGVKLVVGPQSAGADPGPACYGRGGPLTVTDVNLFLGRIPEREFPFPLNRPAVEQHLSTLCEAIAASPSGRCYEAAELAAGFVEIANANMVRAIRRISIARGYDPADYVLVPFGGAGGQHACAIARTLGIRQILIHPYAGILSAYGIGFADIRRHQERAVLERLSAESLAALEPTFVKLESAAIEDIRREDVPPDRISSPQRSLDLRYEGVEASINVPQPDQGDYRAAYETRHEQLYGYRRSGRPIEIVAARVEVVGKTPAPITAEQPPQRRRLHAEETVPVVFAGTQQPTGLFHRRELHAGDEIVGPAIVCEPTSTVVIDPGFAATVLPRGEILISDSLQTSPSPGVAAPGLLRVATPGLDCAPDPVRLEIFNNLFASIAEQMGVTLQMTAVSTNVKERLDFSCAVFDATGGLVVNAPHIPVHLGAMSETVRRVIADNPAMSAGDVFV
ncbi:MAG: hydantoinase/oxoprolinase family protein, partial [Planctomycetaceae bacterium]